MIVESVKRRQRVADTDIGVEIKERIRALEDLLQAYRDGSLIEKGI